LTALLSGVFETLDDRHNTIGFSILGFNDVPAGWDGDRDSRRSITDKRACVHQCVVRRLCVPLNPFSPIVHFGYSLGKRNQLFERTRADPANKQSTFFIGRPVHVGRVIAEHYDRCTPRLDDPTVVVNRACKCVQPRVGCWFVAKLADPAGTSCVGSRTRGPPRLDTNCIGSAVWYRSSFFLATHLEHIEIKSVGGFFAFPTNRQFSSSDSFSLYSFPVRRKNNTAPRLKISVFSDKEPRSPELCSGDM